MPTNVIPNSQGFPFPLGKIFPGASYATLSVPLTQNIQPVDAQGNVDNQCWNGIFIQADLNNAGVIYICSNNSAPDLVAFTNVLGEVTAGGSYPRSKDWANNRDISRIFIGATNATDFVIASIDAF